MQIFMVGKKIQTAYIVDGTQLWMRENSSITQIDTTT